MVMGDGSWNCFCGCFVSALFLHPWAKVVSSTLAWLGIPESKSGSVRFGSPHFMTFQRPQKPLSLSRTRNSSALGHFRFIISILKKSKNSVWGSCVRFLCTSARLQTVKFIIVDSPRQFSLTSVFVDISFRFEWFARFSVKRRRMLRPAVQHQ